MEKILAILLVALGTYLTRVVPLSIKIKRAEDIETLLSYSSSALLSALFVTSLVSFPLNISELGISTVALIFVVLTYLTWKNLGLSVLVGVVGHLIFNALL